MLSDSETLLSLVPADGSPIGNQRLRESLGWEEDRYLAARAPLIASGQLLTGSGRGGSVRLAQVELEMFPLAAIGADSPLRPDRPSKQSKANVPPSAPATTYQFSDATRKNIPPAGLAAKSSLQENHPHRLSYDPNLSPVLLFDGSDSNTASIALGYANGIIQSFALDLRSQSLKNPGSGISKAPIDARLRMQNV
jgi:hypothetical protein